MKWSTPQQMQANGAGLRDRLMKCLKDAHTPRPDQKVVNLRARNLVSLQRFIDATLLTETVQVYFSTERGLPLAGLPISMAVDEACRALQEPGRSIDQVLEGEVKSALIALQLLDAAIAHCSPPLGEPRIEVLLNETTQAVGLRIPQRDDAVIVTPGSFIHDTYNFTTAEPVMHPGSWFQMSQEALEAELLS